MLVLTRNKNEKIIVTTKSGDVITVLLVDIRGDKVRIGIDAPLTATIHRAEVQEVIDREAKSH